MATLSIIIRSFFNLHYKRELRLYIACCRTSKRFLRLGSTPRAELRLMEFG